MHATGQVATVTAPAPWTAAELARSLNALLPGTIWVRDIEPVPDGFHPRYGAISRSYEYRIGTAPHADRRWCWPLRRPLDLKAANRAARLLPGEHAFRAFAKSGQPQRGYVCRGRRREEEMALLLKGNTELRTSRPAPPQGLFLTRVEYPADHGPATSI